MAIVLNINIKGTITPLELTEKPVILGRSSKCKIVLDDEKSSRQHCSVFLDETKVASIKDLGSTNGTLMNKFKIMEDQIFVGDVISVGEITMSLDQSKMTREEKLRHMKKMSPGGGAKGKRNKSITIKL